MITRRLHTTLFVLVLAVTVHSFLHAQGPMLREQIEQARAARKADTTAGRGAGHRLFERGESGRDASQRSAEAPGTADGIVNDGDMPESEVHAAVNPTDSNNIIVVPTELDPNTGKFTLHIYYTRDFGRTWKKSAFTTVPNIQTTTTNAGDPVVAFDNDGRAFVMWIDLFAPPFKPTYYGIVWAYSDDGGETWKQPDPDAGILFEDNLMYDKEWIAVDRTSTSHRNTIYVAFFQFGASASRIVVRSMAPGAMRFGDTVTVVSDTGFTRVQVTSIDVDVDGRVHVVYFGERAGDVYGIWHVVSSDGGAHFSPPRMIAPLTLTKWSTPATATITAIEGVEARRMYPFPQIASDASSRATRGNLYVAWTVTGTTSDRGDGLDIYCARSTDHGATWSDPIVVNDDPRGLLRHQHHSSLAVSPDGAVVVSWYDRRDDPAGRLARYSMAYSFDGGATFLPTIPVAGGPMDFRAVGGHNSGFGIGEYTQVVTTSGYAIPVWSDGRTDDGDVNIYAAVVPISPAVSAVDRVTTVTEELTVGEPAVSGDEVALTLRLTAPGRVSVRVHDAAGRLRATLADARHAAGELRVSGSVASLPSGRYFIRIEAPGGRAVRSFGVVR